MITKLGRTRKAARHVALTRLGVVAAAACLVGAVAACGSTGAATGAAETSAAPAKVDSIAAMVPKTIADKGTLVVAAEVYPPAVIEPAGGGEPTGWDIENARSIAAVLGLKTEVKIIPFDGMIPGLQAHRYDAAVGEVYITPERTSKVTFISNHKSTDAMLVGANSKLTNADDKQALCGLTLAAQLGSAEQALLEQVSKECTASGKPAATVKTFQDQSSVNLALQGGRIDGAVSSASQVANVLQQTKNQFKLVALPWAPSYYTGMALGQSPDTAQMAKAVQAATDYLIKNGTLQKILDKFNQGQGAITKSEILPAPASS